MNCAVIQIEKAKETKVFYNGVMYFNSPLVVMDLLLIIREESYISNIYFN